MENIIEVQKLTKVFSPDIKAVNGISFAVQRGEVFGFLGPNGAGKSTTIKILTTLLRKTSGRARIDGLDVEKDAAAVRKIIGYAAQDVGVDSDLTGRENLKIQCRFYHVPPGEIDDRVNELLKTVDLTEAADRRAGTYSGGMRKRLDLASALIHRPKLLFLDEPTTGLDPQNRRALWEYIKDLNAKGMTIFLTTQYMEEADQLSKRLSIIDHGRIVAAGTPPALKAQIGADVVQVTLKNDGVPEVRAKARAALSAIPGIREVQDYDGSVAIYAQNGSAVVPQIVRALDAAGTDIGQLTLSGPTLDDVFLKYTGHKMRTEEVRPAGRSPYARRRRM